MANPDAFARAAAEEWRELLDRQRRVAGPQGRTACGPTTDNGFCINANHTPGCAASMSSATVKATFKRPGEPGYEAAWDAAREERRRMHEMVRTPAALKAEQERDRKAAEAKADKAHTAALRETGGNWAETGRGPEWLTARAR